MNTADLVVTSEAEEGFYPTPPEVADMLLDDYELWKQSTILEPSAGSGNLIHAMLKKYSGTRGRYSDSALEIDCVEIDPHLRAVLQYEFGGGRIGELYSQKSDLDKYSYSYLSDADKQKFDTLYHQIHVLQSGKIRIIHDDFLSLETCKRYDLIIMNPPFANGDAHLLKAIQMQSRSGGDIRCILNAETLRNPYTNRRRLLQQKLLDLKAEVTFHKKAFSNAERQTDVEIAIIRISIPAAKEESVIFERLRKAAKIDEPRSDVQDMTVSDFMEQIVSLYKVECDAGIELIREYIAMRPYIMRSFEKSAYESPTLSIMVGEARSAYYGEAPKVNEYLRLVRRKYWTALFNNKEFIGRLTSNLLDKYREKISSLVDYDFSLFNIQRISAEMNAEMGKGIEDTIVAMFDKLTAEYSYYPETTRNRHYYNGWKTNKVHKINSKVIVPIYGVFATYSWRSETFKVREAEATISDIEKVFDYLDGNMTAEVSLHGALERACAEGRTRNIQCKYFDVTLYKKGTMHIRFHNQELVDRFNIYCSRKKNWLPPNYGRATYSEMTSEEQAVVDSFHGDGASGSGAESYAKVLERSHYFLSEPTREVQLLTSGA